MRILALDAATVTGWAVGDGSAVPDSGSIRLTRGEGEPEDLPASMGVFLNQKIFKWHPYLIVLEKHLPPGAQLSQGPVMTSLRLDGAVCAVCGIHQIPFATVSAATWRKHFCGRATSNLFSRGPKTARMKEENRAATKAMVRARAKELGWMPQDCDDSDRADALGILAWALATYSEYGWCSTTSIAQ